MAKTWIKLLLLLLALAAKAQKAASSEFKQPQRSKEDHFPNQPELPQQMFLLVSEANNTREQNIIDDDTPGLPLGSNIDDFEDIITSPSLTVSDDAVVIDPKNPLEGDLFEGDISGVKLTTNSADLETDEEANLADEKEDSDVVVIKNAIKNTYQRWPNGEIPYVISNSFGSQERSVIRAAMEQFSLHSCVKWRPHMPSDVDYVHILRDTGCYSRVGKTGRAQVLSLGYGCVSVGTVVHEMLHAAGFWHEQSRPDRDEHVQILWANILPGLEDNFARYSRAEVSTLSLPYDTESVMHYGATAFSRNGQVTINPYKTKITALGQRRGFTQLDIEKLNKLYQCQNLPTATLVTDPNCKDEYVGLCQTWKVKGGCSSYPAFMRDYCKRTCGLCPLVPSSSLLTSENPNPIVVVASKCFDADKRCPAWAAYANQCKTNRLFMAKTCKKSCGLCSGFSGDQPMLASVGSSISHFSLVLLLYIVLPCLLPL